jgi:hypothetical protein
MSSLLTPFFIAKINQIRLLPFVYQGGIISESKKKGQRISNLDDELRLLERETNSALLKENLQNLRERSSGLEISK